MRKKNLSDQQTVESSAANRKTKNKYRPLRWERLDNTAHLFPVIASQHKSNVYRISVTLKEAIEPELLQQALDIVLPKFPGFDLRLRYGVFWNYFEENGKSAPRVREERNFPCRYIRPNRNNSYLFRVTYYKCRINLEVFHALTDGMGGINFIKELCYQYLRLAHPDLSAQKGDLLSSETTLSREDSYLKNFKKNSPKQYATKKAYLIKGEKLHEGEFGVMHGYLNIPQLKAVCKKRGVTINEYLVSAYIWSIYTEYLNKSPSKLPIRVAVPVNLRPHFNSNTSKNFFVMVSAEFMPIEQEYSFEDVIKIICESLRSQIESEHLEQIFSYNVSRQRSIFLKILPMPIKHIGMRFVYNRSALANTSTVSNVGRISVDELYRPYIEIFHAYMSISKGQFIKGTVCSFEDTLVFSFSYGLHDVSLQRGFFKTLAADGLDVEIESNGVNYG